MLSWGILTIKASNGEILKGGRAHPNGSELGYSTELALYLDKVYLTDHSLDTSIIVIYEKVLVS